MGPGLLTLCAGSLWSGTAMRGWGLHAAPRRCHSANDTYAVPGVTRERQGPVKGKKIFFSPQTHRLGCPKAAKDSTDQFHLFSRLPFGGSLLVQKGKKRRKFTCISDSPLGISPESLLTHWGNGGQPSYFQHCSSGSRREQAVKLHRAP